MSFKLCLATKNPGKIREIREILGDGRIELCFPPAGMEFPPENGSTFRENSLGKALAMAGRCGDAFLAGEDSGLIVPSIGGLPGVRSARFAGEGSSDGRNIEKLLEYLEKFDGKKREAFFICVIALVTPSGDRLFFEGRLEGRISREPRGVNGFGYDPVFEIPELGKTAAELALAEKNGISHRARAFEGLKKYLEPICG